MVEDSILETYPTDITEVDERTYASLPISYKTIAASCVKGIDTAGDAGDEDTADLLTEVSRIVIKRRLVHRC